MTSPCQHVTENQFTSIEKIINDTLIILQLVKDVPKMNDSSFDAYQAICRRMPEQISTGRLKIAVVGVIKSGKSTFVNSLLGKELVKRGAGVITSITTRIRKGKKNRACLYFKSWDDINSQLKQSLTLFPGDEKEKIIIDGFDIRRKNDRNYLESVYQTLLSDFPVTEDGISPETLLIRHALCGFDTCKDLVKPDESITCFQSNEFDRHKAFTSDPGKAFYIKDVCLDLFGKIMEPHIEIADCQGADSTDPAQLAHVLSYLELSNLIVYCISSRTGLRQSDITFLKQIKNLGLLHNILFINNCDLTEHESLEDLIKIEKSIKENLEFLDIQPVLFSFSALNNLFSKLGSKLSKKDSGRLQLWQEEKNMIEYSDLQTEEFNSFFNRVINKNRYELLISNHLKRMGIILQELDSRADLFLDLLSSDNLKEKTAIKTLEHLHQNASRLETIVANSIEGAVNGIKDEIESNLKAVFVQDQASILKKAREYISTFSIDVEKYRSTSDKTGFKKILYLMFQEFKRKFDLYVIEQINPELKKILEAQEIRITSYFQSLFDSYQIDLLKDDQYSELETESKLTQNGNFIDFIDIEKIKKILGLQFPAVIFEAKYTQRIKASVFTNFGLQTMSQLLSSLVNPRSGFSFSPGLKKAAAGIKKENIKIIKDQFMQLHIKLQTNYFLPLIDAATREFKEKINERFVRYHSCKTEIEHLFSLSLSEKRSQTKKVLLIKEQIQRVFSDISTSNDISWVSGEEKD